MTDSIEIINVLSARAANDNDGRPVTIPIFTVLLARHDLTLVDVLVYGGVVAYESEPAPGIDRLASVLGVHRRTLINSLRALRDCGLVERTRPGSRGVHVQYAARGPRTAA